MYSPDGNDSEADEQVDSVSASGQDTPDDSSVRAVENGFANCLSFAETEAIRAPFGKGLGARKAKENLAVGNADKKMKAAKAERADCIGKVSKEVTEKKDVKDKREKNQPSKNDKRKNKKIIKN